VASEKRSGPLKGVRIVELAAVGPGPFCAMLLADMGAEVITVDRTTPSGLGIKKDARFNPTTRSRPSMAVDLKSASGRAVVLRLLEQADVLIEGFRPGVMERLGLGPDVCWKRNRRLVFGRATGWGQEGPMAESVGHDLNYLALSGALSMLGPRDREPAIPLNLLGDYAGGGLYLALGIVSAVLEAKSSGQGQIVDAAMIDGIESLLTHHFAFIANDCWVPERESNFFDGGAPWYRVYETKDGKHVSVAPVERKFYDQLLDAMGLDPATVPDQLARDTWPDLRRRFAEIFRTRTRDEWCQAMEGREACFAPVLSIDEAIAHPHLRARHSFVEVDGVVQPAPAPRFSRTPSSIHRGPPIPGSNTDEIMSAWGFTEHEIAELRKSGAIA
jgi:alpha-methylacyl-CoA racemase